MAKRNILVLISKSAPINLAVRLAAEAGIILIGFERVRRMNVYANEWRVYNGKRNLYRIEFITPVSHFRGKVF